MKPPTVRSEEFLRQFRRYGQGLTVGQFSRRHGYDYPDSIRRWQQEIEGFSDALAVIQAEHDSPMKFGLTEEQGAFLSHFRESKQIKRALDQVQWNPNDLEMAQKNPAFVEEMDLIRKEIKLLAEDALAEKAMEGNLGHVRMYLEAVDPGKYAKKIQHRVSGNVGFSPAAASNRAAFWSQRLAGHLPAAPEPKQLDGDVVDAEFVTTDGEPN